MLKCRVNVVVHLYQELCRGINDLLTLTLGCKSPDYLVSFKLVRRYEHFDCEVLRIDFLILLFIRFVSVNW